jgi:hypothetical protein
MVKSRRMGWAGHVARIERLLVEKPEGKGPPGRPRHRWVNIIKVDVREIGWAGLIVFRMGTSGGLL